MSAETHHIALTRGNLSLCALACSSDAPPTIFSGCVRLTTSPGSGEGLLATDGKRLHATRSALAPDASHLAWIPARASDALDILAPGALPSDVIEWSPWGASSQRLVSGEHGMTFPLREVPGPNINALRNICAARGDEVARVTDWRRYRLSSYSSSDMVLISGRVGDDPPSPLRIDAWCSSEDVIKEERDALLEKTRGSLRTVLRASFLKDAVRFVSNGGDPVTVTLPTNGASGFGQGQVRLSSGTRVALVMPINAKET